MSWSWSFMPQRLMNEDAYLELSLGDRGLLLSLYHRCDKWGRGPGGLRALATLLGVDRDGLADSMERLYTAKLVHRVHADWQIDRYDEDAEPVGLLKRRATPSVFGQPQHVASADRPTTSDGVGHAAPLTVIVEHSQPSTVAVEQPQSLPDNVAQPPPLPDDAVHRPVVPDNVGRCRQTSAPDETETRLDETRRDEGGRRAPPPARSPAPTPPPARAYGAGLEWPSEEHRAAAELFAATQVERGPAGAGMAPQLLAAIAATYRDVFVATVAYAVATPAWGGWGYKTPKGWLDTECKKLRLAAEPPSPPPDPRARLSARPGDRPVEPSLTPHTVTTLDSVGASAWARTVERLRKCVDAWEFRSWFAGIQPAGRRDDGWFILGVPDESHARWVEANFSDALREAWAASGGVGELGFAPYDTLAIKPSGIAAEGV